MKILRNKEFNRVAQVVIPGLYVYLSSHAICTCFILHPEWLLIFLEYTQILIPGWNIRAVIRLSRRKLKKFHLIGQTCPLSLLVQIVWLVLGTGFSYTLYCDHFLGTTTGVIIVIRTIWSENSQIFTASFLPLSPSSFSSSFLKTYPEHSVCKAYTMTTPLKSHMCVLLFGD